MNYFKLPNRIFDLGLSSGEFLVYAYLCSVHSNIFTFTGREVTVKQSTIARHCGYKSIDAVNRIIGSLAAKELVEVVHTRKSGGHTGTNKYIVHIPNKSCGFFMVNRRIFASMPGMGKCDFMVYLYIQKCASANGKCFPSLRKISGACGISLPTVIKSLDRLAALRLIRKQNRRKKDGSFMCNLYTFVRKVLSIFRRVSAACKRIYGTAAPVRFFELGGCLNNKDTVILPTRLLLEKRKINMIYLE